jgi:sugar transferase (PEP-CTERM system associated)
MAPLRVFSHYVSPLSLLLVGGDAVMLTVSVHLAARLLSFGQPLWIGDPPLEPKIVAFVLLGLLSFFVAGVYDPMPSLGRIALAARVLMASAAWSVLYSAIAFSSPALRLARPAALGGFLIAALGAIGLRWTLSAFPAAASLRERLLFIGATPLADRLIDEVKRCRAGYEIVGYVDDRAPHEVALNNGYRILGQTSRLADIARTDRVGTVVVTLEERRRRFPTEVILDCKLRGIRIEDWPAFYEKLTGKIVVQNLRPSWLLFSDGFRRTRMARFGKRVGDILMSSLVLLAGWPLFALVALAVKWDSRGPVFFRQERVGEGGTVFSLLKFRTMRDDAEHLTGPVWATKDDPRITRVGEWLRKTRLDEFPQVINVLKGEMSFIGPRPERPYFVSLLEDRIPYYSQRHTVKPGITGWAQVRYQYGATIEAAEEKLQYDLYYIKNMSLFLDLVILLSSVQVLLSGRGAR